MDPKQPYNIKIYKMKWIFEKFLLTSRHDKEIHYLQQELKLKNDIIENLHKQINNTIEDDYINIK